MYNKKIISSIIALIAFLMPISAFAFTTRVSVNDNGDENNSDSYSTIMTPNGQFILFHSYADNLVANDNNGSQDIFVRDIVNNTTTRVSVDSNGNDANSDSTPTAITPDGQFVLFHSYADNLVANDNNASQDVFVRDMVNNTTTRVSVDSNGNDANSDSTPTAITPDGRFVLFVTNADNLVANDTNGTRDVFVRDMVNNTTTRISVDSNGNDANNYSAPIAITADGQFVLFNSYADNLVANDTNVSRDIFVRDIVNNTTTRVSADSNGNESNSDSYAIAITPDGQFVLFNSYADNLVANDNNGSQDTFVRDMVNNTTTRVSVDSSGNEGNGDSLPTAITPDGQFVLFNSYADNLVANDNNGSQDIFVRDMVNNTTTRMSVDSNGNESNSDSYPTSITPDGQFVLFHSYADNLVANDTNGSQDIFVRDMVNNTTTRVNIDSNGNESNSDSYSTIMTPNGQFVLFDSYADNLVANDTNGSQDVFVNERQIVLGAAPTIVTPVDGSYRNSIADIIVEGVGLSGADIRVTFLGNQFYTTVGSNNEWNIQLPQQLDATYTVYAQQKSVGSGLWSTTGQSTFTIDSIHPAVPTIITPIEGVMISGGNMWVVGEGEIGGEVSVKVGKTIKHSSIDGMGNWTVGPFAIAPGYKYGIVAKQSDIAGNVSEWSDVRTIYGVAADTLSVNDSDYIPDLILSKSGISGTGSIIYANPNDTIQYTLNYLNAGNGYATGVTIYEKIPVNTCFTIGSIHGLPENFIVEYSNDSGMNYGYVPVGTTGQQDCLITHFRVIDTIPYEAKINVVSDDFVTSNESHIVYAVNNVLTSSIGVSLDTRLMREQVLPGGLTSFHQGEGLISTTVIDLDQDGDQDIIGYGHGRDSSQIYWNDGSGNFTDNNLPGGNTNFVGGSVGDFNSDGFIDIVGFGYINQRSVIYFNNGDNTFTNMLLPGNHMGSHQGFVEDLDNDGDVDIITFGFNGINTVLYINDGSGNFTDSDFPGGTAFFAGGAKGDINNDGLVDIIGFGRENTDSKIYLNNGSGNFTDSILPGGTTRYGGGKLIDLDTDGDLDVIGFSNSPTNPSKIYVNDGSGNFTPTDLPGGNTYFIGGSVVDINNDTYLDMVGYGGYYGAAYTKSYINDGSGNFTVATLPGGYTSFVGGLAYDADADSDIDVVGLGNGNTPTKIFYNNGDGSFIDTIAPGGNTSFVGGATGDFNNDGLIDFVGMGFGYTDSKVFFAQIITGGSYTSILYSTGNNSGRDKLLLQDEIVSGDNNIEYTIYGVLGGNVCDVGNILKSKTQAVNGEVDISSITGANSAICIQVDLTVLTGNTSPVLRSMIATWNSEDIDSFTFDVKVNSGNFVGTTVVNTAYIGSNMVEINTGNNTDSYSFDGLPIPVPVHTGSILTGNSSTGSNQGGFGGGIGGSSIPTLVGASNGGNGNGGAIKVTSSQELAETIIRLYPVTTPIIPVVSIPTGPTTTVEITATTPNIAIRDAIVQTTNIQVGSVVSIKTVENPALASEKKCYSPKEVVEITLGKNTTHKDQMVYQALLKSYDLTMFTDTDEYRPDSGLKRYEAAKMFVNFAKHVLCREAKQTYINQYDDIEGFDHTLIPYVKTAYEYGILKGSKGKFRPLEVISQKEFIAALMRMFINEDMDVQGKGNNWDMNYVQAFKDYGLDSIVGIDESIERYDMSKIMYKLYYNTTYKWTDKGYVLPYSK